MRDDHLNFRDAVIAEEVEIVSRQDLGAQQYLFKFRAPLCARAAQPGQFIRVSGDDAPPQQLAILRANPWHGSIEVVCKGQTSALLHKHVGDKVSLAGPLGASFIAHANNPRAVLIGEDQGIAAVIFLAERLRNDVTRKPLVFLGSETPFPFRARPSTIMVDGMPDGAIAALAFLDEQGIASRLSSHADLPGCHDGDVIDLANAWLSTLNQDTLAEVELFACGPTALLNDAAQLARHFDVACQISAEISAA